MRNCTIYVAKTKALISLAVTAKLICAFVFSYAKIRFSHDAAQLFYNGVFIYIKLLPSTHNSFSPFMYPKTHIFSNIHVFLIYS